MRTPFIIMAFLSIGFLFGCAKTLDVHPAQKPSDKKIYQEKKEGIFQIVVNEVSYELEITESSLERISFPEETGDSKECAVGVLDVEGRLAEANLLVQVQIILSDEQRKTRRIKGGIGNDLREKHCSGVMTQTTVQFYFDETTLSLFSKPKPAEPFLFSEFDYSKYCVFLHTGTNDLELGEFNELRGEVAMKGEITGLRLIHSYTDDYEILYDDAYSPFSEDDQISLEFDLALAYQATVAKDPER